MKKDIITTGAQIDTIEGYEVVKSYNGSIVYTDSYEYDDDGNPQKTGECRLTLEEVGKLMKGVDGRNHRVTFEA